MWSTQQRKQAPEQQKLFASELWGESMPVNLEVISSAQAGDENSFEAILEDVSPIIKKLCGRYHHPSMDY
ncbi:MAG: hypothetical protein GX176_00055, partial [Syntrophomonadaceae bacterium]|nr:hypothetical protein [Syntrophomonadaceae bacterium]